MSEIKMIKECDDNDNGPERHRMRPVITNSGVGGSLTNNNDGEFSVDILPREMWMHIFKKLDPNELAKCWNPKSTSVWTKILDSDDFYYKMTLPFVFPYLDCVDLLKCSAVSKAWNAEVDAYIHQLRIFEDFGTYSCQRYQQLALMVDSFHMPESIRKFVWSNNDSRGKTVAVNPVPFRRVVVRLAPQRSNLAVPVHSEPYLNPLAFDKKNLLQCLDYFGHFVRSLDLGIGVTITDSCLDIIKLVRNCLVRMPNLRVLTFSAKSEHKNVHHENELEAYISANPWPALKCLQAMKFDNYADQEEFGSTILAYAYQLVYLQCQFAVLDPRGFPVLQQIRFQFEKSFNGMKLATFVQSSKCSLKHLSVEFGRRIQVDVESRNGLVLATNAAKATLEILIFRLSFPNLCFELNELKINQLEQMRLRKLKELQLHDDYFGYPSLQFLQNVCPALQELTVLPKLPNAQYVEVIKAGEMYSDLYSRHQFWNELSHIKKINVNYMNDVRQKRNTDTNGTPLERKVHKVYTRDIYNQMVNQPLASTSEAGSS